MSNIRSSYKTYKNKRDKDKCLSEKEYVKINNLFNKFIVTLALEGHKVTLPSRMGKLWIEGKKRKIKFGEDGKPLNLPPDWVGTKRLWDNNKEAKKEKRLLYLTNNHSDGYTFKWMWSKKRIFVKNKSLYNLRMSRDNKRAVNKLAQERNNFITVN